jgi:AcrR family transcriptional regulator
MSTGWVSPRRADTRRNHERILAAALKSLSASGEVSFNAIAKQAQVGVGTVYRHFPTPEALVLAVYRHEVSQLVDAAAHLLRTEAPAQAFRDWTQHLARYMMTKRGLAGALRAAASSQETMFAEAHAAMLDAVARLVAANVAAGTIRDGLDPATVLRALGGLLQLNPDEDWRAQADDVVDVLWNGLRPRD